MEKFLDRVGALSERIVRHLADLRLMEQMSPDSSEFVQVNQIAIVLNTKIADTKHGYELSEEIYRAGCAHVIDRQRAELLAAIDELANYPNWNQDDADDVTWLARFRSEKAAIISG